MLFNTVKIAHSQMRMDVGAAELRRVLSFSPANMNMGAQVLFDNLVEGGTVVTILPSTRTLPPESIYFELMRKASKRGVRIVRLYLLPYEQNLLEPDVRRHWALDTEAGIQVEFRIMEPGLVSSVPLSSMRMNTLDFGIWDSSVATYLHYGSESLGQPQISGWIVSGRDEDLESASKKWQEMRQLRMVPVHTQDDAEMLGICEPIQQTCSFSDWLASFICASQPSSCRWLHGAWQYLRCLDLVSSPSHHASLFLDGLAGSKSLKSPPRILIWDPRDYSLTAHAIHACESRHGSCDSPIRIFAECDVPLLLSQWYAARRGIGVSSFKPNGAISRGSSGGIVDVIASHLALDRLDVDSTSGLLTQWHTSLKANGILVLTSSLRNGQSTMPLRLSSSEVSLFKNRALDLATLWHPFTKTPPRILAELAAEYAAQYAAYPFHDESDIQVTLQSHGFRILRASTVPSRGTPQHMSIAEIVAEKA